MKEGFESWLIKYGSDEMEVTTLYKHLTHITGVLHDMKIGSAETRIDLIHECWNLQKKIGKLYDEIDEQLQTAIDTHQKRTIRRESEDANR